MSLDHLTLSRRSYGRAGRPRPNPIYTGCTGWGLSPCVTNTMPGTPWNRIAPRSDRAAPHKTSGQQHTPIVEAMEDWEFSEVMRSRRFPAGWYMLPSLVVGCLWLVAVWH